MSGLLSPDLNEIDDHVQGDADGPHCIDAEVSEELK